jgi:hypothetical protein
MQEHEYYEELCALLPIGQLSGEEYQELAEHLKGCPSCRHATDDFSVILDKMPVGDTDVDEKSIVALQRDSYRDRFLKRAMAEGIPFSHAVMGSPFSVRTWSLPRLRIMPALATAAIAIIVLLIVQVFRLRDEALRVSRQPSAQQSAKIAQTLKGEGEQPVPELEPKVTALQKLATQQGNTISDIKAELSKSRAETEIANRQLTRTADQLVQLQKEAIETQRALDSAKVDLNRARSEKDSVDAALVDQQFKISELAAQVKEKEALAERERQLSSVAKDVRELMGARNLHIVDVSDIDSNGRSKKSIGRVFLVEGKSLIFYAFDLGDRGNPTKVSFQAWGLLEGRQRIARNLGVFYVDDHDQKRWVLKVNDPEKLSAINSVFVTVEPLGGATRPTGKKLLYAFLGTQPNHP